MKNCVSNTGIGEKNIPSYLCPLFWQHGEQEEDLVKEIRAMHEKGIGSFIVESRPHPDFMGAKWWSDLECIIREAKKRNMKVWIFDDSAYPSGYGAGIIKKQYPQYLKRYLRECHIDARGPVRGSSFFISSWLEEDEQLIKVIAAKRKDGNERLEEDQLYDVTSYIKNGILFWDVPEGAWRIYIIVNTRQGGEEWTKDYVNPIYYEAVTAYIHSIYDKHYEMYHEEFGKTIQGFFVDEPRFGNASGYEIRLGETNGGNEEYLGTKGIVVPYEPQLLDKLSEELGKDCSIYLPYLWSDDSETSKDIRYAYMNLVSKLMSTCFIGQIGNWCREHGVDLIGHVVEDNGAHARLAYGAGHFFRSMDGMSASGFDVVYHIWPEYMSGKFETPFGYLDARFFYWGLSKMATSLAHIDQKKNGVTVCEVFGAYGWQEGLKLMKWITDHICVRGTNFIIPHAFSPKDPDPDCPPHFYAGGKNPQWKNFKIWADYANRVCHILTGGAHVATAAVLYHAEAEWGGQYEPFEKAVQSLMEQQIDCDVVSADYLTDSSRSCVEDKCLKINKEKYQVLIVPYAEVLEKNLLIRLIEFAENGLHVVFMKDFPSRIFYSRGKDEVLQSIRAAKYIFKVQYEDLVSFLKHHGLYDIDSLQPNKYLRCYHCRKEGKNIYFFTNESKYETVNVPVILNGCKAIYLYDAMGDMYYQADAVETGDHNSVLIHIKLRPYESIFVVEGVKKNLPRRFHELETLEEYEIKNDWEISISGNASCLSEIKKLQNMSASNLLPEYSGDFYYKTSFAWDKDTTDKRIFLDLGEVYENCEVKWNGFPLGTKICPPYVYDITAVIKKENEVFVTVTNTYAKERGRNIFDRSMAQEPSGLIGPVKIVEKK